MGNSCKASSLFIEKDITWFLFSCFWLIDCGVVVPFSRTYPQGHNIVLSIYSNKVSGGAKKKKRFLVLICNYAPCICLLQCMFLGKIPSFFFNYPKKRFLVFGLFFFFFFLHPKIFWTGDRNVFYKNKKKLRSQMEWILT